jgi:hypothetical protein
MACNVPGTQPCAPLTPPYPTTPTTRGLHRAPSHHVYFVVCTDSADASLRADMMEVRRRFSDFDVSSPWGQEEGGGG